MSSSFTIPDTVPREQRSAYYAELERAMVEVDRLLRFGDENHAPNQEYIEIYNIVLEQARLFESGAPDPSNLSTSFIGLAEATTVLNGGSSGYTPGEVIQGFAEHLDLAVRLTNQKANDYLQYTSPSVRIEPDGAMTFVTTRWLE